MYFIFLIICKRKYVCICVYVLTKFQPAPLIHKTYFFFFFFFSFLLQLQPSVKATITIRNIHQTYFSMFPCSQHDGYTSTVVLGKNVYLSSSNRRGTLCLLEDACQTNLQKIEKKNCDITYNINKTHNVYYLFSHFATLCFVNKLLARL